MELILWCLLTWTVSRASDVILPKLWHVSYTEGRVFGEHEFWWKDLPRRYKPWIDDWSTCDPRITGFCSRESPLTADERILMPRENKDYTLLSADLSEVYLTIAIYDRTTYPKEELGEINLFITDFESNLDNKDIAAGKDAIFSPGFGPTVVGTVIGNRMIDFLVEGLENICPNSVIIESLQRLEIPTIGRWSKVMDESVHLIIGLKYPQGYLEYRDSAIFRIENGSSMTNDYTINDYSIKSIIQLNADSTYQYKFLVGRGFDKNGELKFQLLGKSIGPRQVPMQFEEPLISFFPQINSIMPRIDKSLIDGIYPARKKRSLTQNIIENLGSYGHPKIVKLMEARAPECKTIQCFNLFYPPFGRRLKYPFVLRKTDHEIFSAVEGYFNIKYLDYIEALEPDYFSEDIVIKLSSEHFNFFESQYELKFDVEGLQEYRFHLDVQSHFVDGYVLGHVDHGRYNISSDIEFNNTKDFQNITMEFIKSIEGSGNLVLKTSDALWGLQLEFNTMNNRTSFSLTDFNQNNQINEYLSFEIHFVEDKIHLVKKHFNHMKLKELLVTLIGKLKIVYRALHHEKVQELYKMAFGDITLPDHHCAFFFAVADEGLDLKPFENWRHEHLPKFSYEHLYKIMMFVLNKTNSGNRLDMNIIDENTFSFSPSKVKEAIEETRIYFKYLLTPSYMQSNVEKYSTYLKMINHPNPASHAERIKDWAVKQRFLDFQDLDPDDPPPNPDVFPPDFRPTDVLPPGMSQSDLLPPAILPPGVAWPPSVPVGILPFGIPSMPMISSASASSTVASSTVASSTVASSTVASSTVASSTIASSTIASSTIASSVSVSSTSTRRIITFSKHSVSSSGTLSSISSTSSISSSSTFTLGYSIRRA